MTSTQRKDKEDAATPALVPAQSLKAIYANCLELFQNKKITSSNAFSCKLLDHLPQIIKSPDFDIRNMQMVGRTLEMGTKIYVCRVDFTYDMVMGLAKRIGAKGKAMERLRELAEQQRQAEEAAEDAEEGMELGDNELDENGEPLYPKERKPREKKKRQGHHVAPKDKIRIVFPEKMEQFADRQRRVKDILNKFKETRQTISQEEFEIRGRVREKTIKVKDTAEQMATVHKFPKAFINAEFGSRIQFLGFVWFPNNVPFEPNLYDTWGRPKQAPVVADESRLSIGVAPPAPAVENGGVVENEQGEYQFDANAEVDYADDGMVAAERFGYAGDSDDEEEQGPARITDLGQVRNMSELAEFYQALRTMGANKKMAFSWAGPNYLRTRGAASSSRPGTANSEKRTRTRKEVKPFEFGKIDWRDPLNHYNLTPPDKIEIDDRTLERWRTTRNTIPFVDGTSDEVGPDFNSEAYSESFESTPQDTNDQVERALRFFVDRKRNILQLFGQHYKANQDASFTFGDEMPLDDGDEVGEAPRSQFENGEDYCSKSMEEAGFSQGDPGGQENPLIGNKGLTSFLSFFPTMTNTGNTDDYEDFMGATVDSEGVKYAKQPKPINMKLLKGTIIRVLKEKLELDDQYHSTQDVDMSTDMLSIIAEVFKKVDERTARFLSTSLLFVALLHVAVELRLFLEKTDGPIENLIIIARSKTWEHRLHIPMPEVNGIDYFALPALPQAAPVPMEQDHEKENEVALRDVGDETAKTAEDDNDGDDEEDVFMRPEESD